MRKSGKHQAGRLKRSSKTPSSPKIENPEHPMPPLTSLQRALSGRLDSCPPEIAKWLLGKMTWIQSASDSELLRVFGQIAAEAVTAFLTNPACLPALIASRLTPRDFRTMRPSGFSVLDGILGLLQRDDLSPQKKQLLLNYALVADQLWIRGFEK